MWYAKCHSGELHKLYKKRPHEFCERKSGNTEFNPIKPATPSTATPTTIVTTVNPKTLVNSRNQFPPSIIKIRSDNRPHAKINILGISVIGLLDSGAQASVAGVLFDNVIKQLNIAPEPCNAVVSVADGTQHTVSLALNLPIQYNGQSENFNVLYVPSLAKNLILGMDFWEKFKIRPIICDLVESNKSVNVSSNHNLTDSEAQKLQNLLRTVPFTKPGMLNQTNVITHTIDTANAKPIKQRQYIVSPYLQNSIDEEIVRLLDLGVIFKCNSSPWNNPMVAVRKPSGKIRLCIDARKLNDVTVKDAYPQPQINRILGRLSGTKYLSAIDLSDAFLQVPLDPDSQLKTAFSISGKGYFAFSRMPFGLCNSAATLCRLVDKVIGCDLEPNVFVYLDDIIIATKTFDEHIDILEKVKARTEAENLTICNEIVMIWHAIAKVLGLV